VSAPPGRTRSTRSLSASGTGPADVCGTAARMAALLIAPHRGQGKRKRCPAIIAGCRPRAVLFSLQFRETRDLSATPQIT